MRSGVIYIIPKSMANDPDNDNDPDALRRIPEISIWWYVAGFVMLVAAIIWLR